MRRALPSTQALACFEAAARHQSYTQAAQELALTQSAVSRQIIALETFLGQSLFKRTRHGVVLTQGGRQYAAQVARWLQGLEHDTLEIMAHQGAGGQVQLAAVPTFATRWLIPRLPQFARTHPDIHVHIDVQTRPFLFSDTALDGAIYAGTPEQVANWPGVRVQWLMDESIVPVCSPQLLDAAACRAAGRAHQPVAPQDIVRLPLLQQSTRPYGWQQWFESAGIRAGNALAGPRYELFSMLAVAAAHGLGVALVPLFLIENELARGELVIACRTPLERVRSYYLITPQQSPSPTLASFAHWLVQVARGGG